MAGNATGYDAERFVSDVDNDLLCAICQGVVRDPILLSCDHIFCKDCIGLWLAKAYSCPVCQMVVHSQRRPPRVLLNIISRLKLRCSEECSEVFTIETIDRHEEQCRLVVNCPLDHCEEKVKLAKFTDHLRTHSQEEMHSTLANLATGSISMAKKEELVPDLKSELSMLRKDGFLSWPRWSYPFRYRPQSNRAIYAMQNDLRNCVMTGNFGEVKLILSGFCGHLLDLNMTDGWSRSLLQIAIRQQDENMAILLLKYGADPGKANSTEDTAIHVAAEENMAGVLDLALALLKSDLINAGNEMDRTALHLAANCGADEAVQVLLKHGADADLKDCNYQTARGIARRAGHMSIVDLLKFAITRNP